MLVDGIEHGVLKSATVVEKQVFGVFKPIDYLTTASVKVSLEADIPS